MNIFYTLHQAPAAPTPISLPVAHGCQLLGRFGLDQASVESAAKLRPSVMVVDIETLPLTQVALTLGRIRDTAPLSKLVVIGVSGGAAMAQLAVASGASAYLTSDRSAKVILSAVQEVAKGKWFLSGTGKRAAVNLLSLASLRA